MELIGRSLETLSKELYNKDTHFVLELIQNADDNSYDDGHEPALVFVVEEHAISLYNNEIGFWNENIDAICNVRKSTKLVNGKHKQGYIGKLRGDEASPGSSILAGVESVMCVSCGGRKIKRV
jgi:hypothetical protein